MPAIQASTCVFHGLVLVLRPPVDGLPSDQPRCFSPVRPEAQLAGQPAVYVSVRPRALRTETAA